jgi:uncharacterized protein (TIGR03435 family)
MIAFVAAHLWQSTLVVVCVALLAPVFRRNRARVRYALWLAASLKFLVPFAILIALGGRVAWRALPASEPRMTMVVDFFNGPFAAPQTERDASRPATPTPLEAMTRGLMLAAPFLWLAGSSALLIGWWWRWRAVARAVRQGVVAQDGVEVEALRRVEARLHARRAVPLVLSDTSIEPGVFGIARPVLLWPRSIRTRLDAAQIEAVMAHELAHVRRRDNAVAALHMAVQALFWFHPFVWWLAARLVDERERACDEDVVRAGCSPQVYAESIVKTCELYVESPLACVAGVTGSNLSERIERIMKNERLADLSTGRRLLLAASAAAAIALPLAVGVLATPRLRAQTAANDAAVPSYVDVVVKRHAADELPAPGKSDADGVKLSNLPLRVYIANAYDIPPGQITGAPDWVGTERYDIEARSPNKPAFSQRAAMMRKLLGAEFKLAAHVERQQLPVYLLQTSRADGTLGPNIRPSACAGKDSPPPPSARPFDPDRHMAVMPCGAAGARPNGLMQARWQSMADFGTHMLAGLTGRHVEDRTGLDGKFDFDVEFIPQPTGPLKPIAPGGYGRQAPFVGPAFFAALEEQLGLKLVSDTGPVDILVVDHVERPSS